MTEKPQETQTFTQLLKTFSEIQLKFIAARMHVKNDRLAAIEIGVDPTIVYAWPNKQDVNEAIRLARLDGISIARERLNRMAQKALDVVESELAIDGEKSHRYDAALEILDRIGLGAIKTTKIEGQGNDGQIVIRLEGNVQDADI